MLVDLDLHATCPTDDGLQEVQIKEVRGEKAVVKVHIHNHEVSHQGVTYPALDAIRHRLCVCYRSRRRLFEFSH